MATLKFTALNARGQIQDAENFAYLTRRSGRSHIPAQDFTYPPSVDASEILEVDFDCDRITCCGLYLVEFSAGGRATWPVCRRFDLRPSGMTMDETGRGDWAAILPVEFRVVGRIARVYGPK